MKFFKIFLTIFLLFLSHYNSIGQTLACPELNVPSDGATEVDVNTDLEWTAITGASGYILTVGTTPGGTDILNNEDVGSLTTYDLINDLPSGQIIYITILPYNAAGDEENCMEASFSTLSADGLPGCALFTSPGHAAEGVSLMPNLVWNSAVGADGYLLTIGRTSDGAVVLDREDVGNVTNYISSILDQNTTYYVAIVPYNDMGSASGCGVQSSFTTQGTSEENIIPCTSLLHPLNGSGEVMVSTEIRWTPKIGVLGYLITVGTTSGGNDILNNLDVGNMTSYQFNEDLPAGITVFTTIKPYTSEGIRGGCFEESFTTQGLIVSDQDLEIPKFFTPNSDGINDEWRIDPPEDISVNQILVFDRFGLLLKQMTPTQSWDGTFNGRKLPSGSYWYSVQLSDASQIRGYFALKR